MTKNQPGAQKSMMSPKKDSIPNHVSLLDHKKEFGTCVETGGEGWFIKEVNNMSSLLLITFPCQNGGFSL